MGLGNPDPAYRHSPHNVGFECISRLQQRFPAENPLDLGDVILRSGITGGKRFVLARPLTWMNLSGRGVKRLLDFLEADVSELVVITDDMDLPLGEIRVRAAGGAGTHRGMRSVIDTLGRSDFARIRIGIHPEGPAPADLAAYVLTPLKGEDQKSLDNGVEKAAAAVEELLRSQSIQAVMNRFNRRGDRNADRGSNALFAPPQGGGCRPLTGAGAADAASIHKEDECNDRTKSGSS